MRCSEHRLYSAQDLCCKKTSTLDHPKSLFLYPGWGGGLVSFFIFICKFVHPYVFYMLLIYMLLLQTLREVQIISNLNHPNIVRYHSSWLEYGSDMQDDDEMFGM